ncbi:MAG: type II toxin-antitoxin system VapC family toxin [Candidatus Altiarchaeia archaeon]|jgi:predicted nucleic acid-binding protein
MECLDSSVLVKWFKADEPKAKEAYALYERAKKTRSLYAANEWLILEVIRGLAKAQVSKENLKEICSMLERMFASGIIWRINVSDVLRSAEEIEIELNLHSADAVHLASAIESRSTVFWTEDEHFHKKAVLDYAKKYGLQIKRL